MQERTWRDRIWARLDQPWDVIVIGGGITGAGILREAARCGLRCLLVEAHDFASGTSSRSSKLVHGGLRYLRTGQVGLTLESVRERDHLVREGNGLVTPLGFVSASYAGDRMPGWAMGAGLAVYDALALRWNHSHHDAAGLRHLCPPLGGSDLVGGYRYADAQTDDARLVVRVLREAIADGGFALSYAKVQGLLRLQSGAVRGVLLTDRAPGAAERQAEVKAPVIINATGAWADELRGHAGGRPRLRLLRGSHLVFPADRLPLPMAVSLFHPQDGRPVFALPWEGVTLLGTTDVDHDRPLETDVAIGADEIAYLLAAAHKAFPGLELSRDDVQATYSGVRAVVDTGKADPSRESREHVLWDEAGLLTVTGGKLTTFRRMAQDALRAAWSRLPGRPLFDRHARVLAEPPTAASLNTSMDPQACARTLGRFGTEALKVVAAAAPGELARVEGTTALWAEVRWAARAEGVVHLDDLMLRRVRLGLQLPDGGAGAVLERVRTIVQPELGWDDARWLDEAAAYQALWRRSHAARGGERRAARGVAAV